jgi:hypothetical protein
MFPFAVEDDLLLNMISINVDIFIFVCLRVENTYSIFKGKAEVQIMAHIYHFGNSIHQNIAFRLHF